MKAILRTLIFKLSVSFCPNVQIFVTFLILLVVAIHFLPQGKIARQDPGTT